MARNSPLTYSIATLGDRTLESLANFGRFWIFAAATLSFIPAELMTRRGWRRLLPQFFAIGTLSVPVVALTGVFVGMVLIVQGWDQFDAANLADRLGGIVNLSLVAELGPVLAGVMVAGRVGGALTAELGTMNVTEQILALRSMGADPVRTLVTPRFIACIALTPLLTLYADGMGALGAWAVYVSRAGSAETYWQLTRDVVEFWDLATGMLKAICFGGSIGLIACYKGFHCRGGAQGVGQACTESFVLSFITILVLDLFLNLLVNALYQQWFGFRSLI
jgi:phospholipid/cholesterol/gamma-HCH transport system permease protein